MYLSQINLTNFRKYSSISKDGKVTPGLSLPFGPQLNLLVGENDSGKTAIIDAIKLVLLTQGHEYCGLEYDDFHLAKGKPDTERTSELRIECEFRDFSIDEASHFIEWLAIEKDGSGKNRYFLRVFLIGRREYRRIYWDVKAGADNEGAALDGKARELLRVTYLKPLRDAESELSPRRNSRLSQILDSHKAFSDKESHALVKAVEGANIAITEYFSGKNPDGSPLEDLTGKTLLEDLNKCLSEFSSRNSLLKSDLRIADVRLKTILEKLSLDLSDGRAGLGSHNLLFVAAEMLLLQRKEYTGLKLALIEEMEAHLHPQAQLRLAEYLQQEAEESGNQLILSTHSPNLASKVKVESLILLKEDKAFPMGPSHTLLEKGDYSFLQRFLDVTKANLFFAQGVILVEGDAENLLIPALAEVVGYPLSKYGVSIVNVGSTAFLRYSRIFQRKDPAVKIDLPVACVTDSDVRPDIYKTVELDAKTECDFKGGITAEIDGICNRYDGLPVKTFVSPVWTLEYSIGMSCLCEYLYKAVLFAQAIQNSDKYGLTDEKKAERDVTVLATLEDWKQQGKGPEEIAFAIYQGIMLKEKVSKAITAQCLSAILKERSGEDSGFAETISKDPFLKYLIDAIKYAARIGEVHA
jgi:putative ATP-dependent endonuclease of the OLD family